MSNHGDYGFEDLELVFEVPTIDSMREFEQKVKLCWNHRTRQTVLYIDRIVKDTRGVSPKPLKVYVNLSNAMVLMLAQAAASMWVTVSQMPYDMAFDIIKGGVTKKDLREKVMA